MLRMRKAQIEQNLAGEQTRLRRVEARLRALERGQVMELRDVVIKNSEPVRLAEAVASAPGFGTENIGPVFRPLFQQVRAHPRDARVRPGINIARYEGPAEDGRAILHVGFDIGSQDVTTGDLLRIVDLPPARVAALVHRGTIRGGGRLSWACTRRCAYITNSGCVPQIRAFTASSQQILICARTGSVAAVRSRVPVQDCGNHS